LPASFARTSAWFAFTNDGQAGLIVTPGALTAPPSVNHVTVQIRPVEAPLGLPPNLAIDGNAYTFDVRGEPGQVALHLARSAGSRSAGGRSSTGSRSSTHVTFRWTIFPEGIYVYRANHWQQLCSLAQSTWTSSTISCDATPGRSGLKHPTEGSSISGTYAVVTAARPGIGEPAPTSRPSSRLPTITLIGLLLAVLAAGGAAGLWLVGRGSRRTRPGSSKGP
jgi:hypothetical protein